MEVYEIVELLASGIREQAMKSVPWYHQRHLQINIVYIFFFIQIYLYENTNNLFIFNFYLKGGLI